MSVLALNITPYITSSIIMQLLTIAIPKLEEMQHEGEEGRKMIVSITRYLTIALSLIESGAMAIGFGRQGLLQTYDAINVITVITTLTAGFCIPDVAGRAYYGKRSRQRHIHRADHQHHFPYPAGHDDTVQAVRFRTVLWPMPRSHV
jgi:hypothetical protein